MSKSFFLAGGMALAVLTVGVSQTPQVAEAQRLTGRYTCFAYQTNHSREFSYSISFESRRNRHGFFEAPNETLAVNVFQTTFDPWGRPQTRFVAPIWSYRNNTSQFVRFDAYTQTGQRFEVYLSNLNSWMNFDSVVIYHGNRHAQGSCTLR